MIKDSIKDLSKLTLFLLGDGGYLSEVEVHGEDERGELGGGGADPERGGGGLVGGGGLGGGVGLGGVGGLGSGGCRAVKDSIKDLSKLGQDSVTVENSFSGGDRIVLGDGGGYQDSVSVFT